MRILFVTEFFPKDKNLQFTGGVEVRTYYLIKELRQHHQVDIISRSPKVIAATTSSLFARFLFIFQAIIKGIFISADIVEGSNFVTYLPAFLIAKLKGIPAIAWYPDVFIGTWQQKFGSVGVIGEIAERFSIKLPWDKIIALSKQTKTKLIQAGVDPRKIIVVYAGINQIEFSLIKIPKYHKPTICCISRLVSYKRVNDLIYALKLIRSHLSQTQLIIIGTGPEEKKLKQLAQKINLAPSIIWMNHLSRVDLIKELKKSHLFCLPSITEGFGLVTLEALAASVPYVNANIAINREITHGGKGGLLFIPQSPQDLAKKIISLLSNKKLYQQKISEAKQLCQNYSWQKSAHRTLAIYQHSLDQKRQ